MVALSQLLCRSQTEGRDSEEGASESCSHRCADGKPAVLFPYQPEGPQRDIEVGNPLSDVAIDVANPMTAESSAPVTDAEEQPVGGMAGRLAKLKQLLSRKA